MVIKENKKGAKIALVTSAILFLFGLAGYFYYGIGSSGVFAMIVGLVCVVFCIRKVLQNNFIIIEEDGFLVKKGKKQNKFYFTDIKKIDTKTVDKKRNIQILSVNFKNSKLDRQVATGLIQPVGSDEAVILNIYEKSMYEICKILKENLQQFNERNQK